MRVVRTLTQQRYPIRMIPNGAPDPCPGGEVPLLDEGGDELLLDDGTGFLLYANCGQAEPECVEVFVLCEDGEVLLLEDGYELLYRGCTPYERLHEAGASMTGEADIEALVSIAGVPPVIRLLNAKGRAYCGALAPNYIPITLFMEASATLTLGEGIRVRDLAEPINLVGGSTFSFDPWLAVPHAWLTASANLAVTGTYETRRSTALLRGIATVSARVTAAVPSAKLRGTARFEPGVMNTIVPAVEPLAGTDAMTAYSVLHEPAVNLLGDGAMMADAQYVGSSQVFFSGYAQIAVAPLNRQVIRDIQFEGSAVVVAKQFLADLKGEARLSVVVGDVKDGTGNISINRFMLTGQARLTLGTVIDRKPVELVGRSRMETVANQISMAAWFEGGSTIIATSRYTAPIYLDLDGYLYPPAAPITGTTGDQSYPVPKPEPIDFVYEGGDY